jgi:hypothetical protein
MASTDSAPAAPEDSAYEAPAIEERAEIAKPLIGFSQER